MKDLAHFNGPVPVVLATDIGLPVIPDLPRNDVILFGNTRKNTIFVDVKTADLSHRHYFFGTPSPLIMRPAEMPFSAFCQSRQSVVLIFIVPAYKCNFPAGP